jgi:hypothetical protein
MKRTCSFLALIIFSQIALTSQTVKWVKTFGGSNTDRTGYSLATDPTGNIYNAGYFSGSANMGGFALTSSGGVDNYVQKLKPDGTTEWCNRIGGLGDEGLWVSVAVSNNTLFVVGYFSGTCTFYGTGGTSMNLTSGGSYDIYALKYNMNGALLSAKNVATGNAEEKPIMMTMDDQSNIYLTGNYGCNSGSSAVFNGTTKTNSGVSDFYLLKLDQNLNQQWVATAGGATDDQGCSIAVDAAKNVYVTLCYWSPITFGSTTLAHAAGGNWDAAIAKYSSTGNFIWAQRVSSAGHDEMNDLAVTADGKLYVAGAFESTATFTTTTGTTISKTSNGDHDAFIAQYDLNGNLVTVKTYGGTGYDSFRGMTLSNAQDSISIAGLYSNTVTFTTAPFTSAGSTDIVLLTLDTACNAGKSFTFGSSGYDEAWALRNDAMGNRYLVGNIGGIGNFDGKAASFSGGSFDVFIARLYSSPSGITPPVCTGSNDIFIYPNPGTGGFTVKLPQGEEGRKYKLALFALDGSLVWQGTTDQSQYIIHADLAAATYLLQITSGSLDITRKVIIKE